jgi:hypothetical protein
MPYYAYSNTEKFYSTAHGEYHLNGLLINKIPAFKKLNRFLVLGNNILYLKNGTTYSKAFVGLENILKILRVDFCKIVHKKQRRYNRHPRFFAFLFARQERVGGLWAKRRNV